MRLAPQPPCGTRSLRGSTTGHRSGGQPGGVQGSGLNVSANGSPPTRPQRQIWGAGWRKPVRVWPGLFQNLPHTSAIEGTCRRQHRCVLQARDGPWHWARAGTSPQRVTAPRPPSFAQKPRSLQRRWDTPGATQRPPPALPRPPIHNGQGHEARRTGPWRRPVRPHPRLRVNAILYPLVWQVSK